MLLWLLFSSNAKHQFNHRITMINYIYFCDSTIRNNNIKSLCFVILLLYILIYSIRIKLFSCSSTAPLHHCLEKYFITPWTHTCCPRTIFFFYIWKYCSNGENTEVFYKITRINRKIIVRRCEKSPFCIVINAMFVCMYVHNAFCN